MWILKCLKSTNLGCIAPPGSGVISPMLITMSQAGGAFTDYCQSPREPSDTKKAFFEAIENCRMARGTGRWRENLAAIGEKNPPEYSDPSVVQFIMNALPNARFIHVVRHPAAVIQSRQDFRKRWGEKNNNLVPPWYWEHDDLTNYRMWIEFERNVLKIKAPVLHVRYEDLVVDPAKEAKRIYEFFGLSGSKKIYDRVRAFVGKSGNDKYYLSVPDINHLGDLMKMYQYKE